MSLPVWVAVVAAGAIGAPARYLVDGWVQDRVTGDFPWGTFTVNTVGSLVLGFVTGLSIHGRLGPEVTAVFAVGFCGAFTTFSTFAFETSRLIEQHDHRAAAINVAGSLVVGLTAAGVGLASGLGIG